MDQPGSDVAAESLVLSCWNLNRTLARSRRVRALLETMGPGVVLSQPTEPYASFRTVPFPVDLGLKRFLINWGIFNLFLPANIRTIRSILRQYRPKIAALTSILDYQPVRRSADLPMVLDAHNCEAVAIEERFGRRHLFAMMIRAWEGRVARAMDHIFVCSEVDKVQFVERYSIRQERVSVTPNGIDASVYEKPGAGGSIDPDLERQLGDATVLFFMGGLQYQPNSQALEFMDGTLMPRLKELSSKPFKLIICGGPIPSGRFDSDIVFAGRVPDNELLAYLARADICLAPIRTGSGTRFKILEYMAAGNPVISTAKGAEGIACSHGRDVIISELDGFAAAVVELAGSEQRAAAIGEAAQKLVFEKYDWDKAVKPIWRSVLCRLSAATVGIEQGN